MRRIRATSFVQVSYLVLFSFWISCWMSISCAPKREASSAQAVDFVSSNYGARKYTTIRISLKGEDLQYVKCENVSNFNCLDSKNKASPTVETGFKKFAQVESFVATHYKCLLKDYRSNIESIKAKLRDNRNYVVAEYSDNFAENFIFSINNLNNGLSDLELKLIKMLYFAVRSDQSGNFCKK